jgi:hypothetical protein
LTTAAMLSRSRYVGSTTAMRFPFHIGAGAYRWASRGSVPEP